MPNLVSRKFWPPRHVVTFVSKASSYKVASPENLQFFLFCCLLKFCQFSTCFELLPPPFNNNDSNNTKNKNNFDSSWASLVQTGASSRKVWRNKKEKRSCSMPQTVRYNACEELFFTYQTLLSIVDEASSLCCRPACRGSTRRRCFWQCSRANSQFLRGKKALPSRICVCERGVMCRGH